MSESYDRYISTNKGIIDIPLKGFDQLADTGIVHVALTPEGGVILTNPDGTLRDSVEPGRSLETEFGYFIFSDKIGE
jgi:hypothetical protein